MGKLFAFTARPFSSRTHTEHSSPNDFPSEGKELRSGSSSAARAERILLKVRVGGPMPLGGQRRLGSPQSSEDGRAAGRVLVVDDDDGVRDFLEAVLARAGFEVAGAATGEEALAQAHQAPPDLVTLDVILPGIDGLETLRRLKRAHPAVRVIMVSGHAPARAGDEALRLGAREFLRKPLEPRELERAVARALGA